MYLAYLDIMTTMSETRWWTSLFAKPIRGSIVTSGSFSVHTEVLKLRLTLKLTHLFTLQGHQNNLYRFICTK